jgi:hypothetical protein
MPTPPPPPSPPPPPPSPTPVRTPSSHGLWTALTLVLLLPFHTLFLSQHVSSSLPSRRRRGRPSSSSAVPTGPPAGMVPLPNTWPAVCSRVGTGMITASFPPSQLSGARTWVVSTSASP